MKVSVTFVVGGFLVKWYTHKHKVNDKCGGTQVHVQ